VPERRSAFVAIKRVNAVVFSGHIDDVMAAAAGDGNARDVEGLGINVPIHRICEQLSEGLGIHVRWRQDGFLRIESGASEIIVIGEHARCGRVQRVSMAVRHPRRRGRVGEVSFNRIALAGRRKRVTSGERCYAKNQAKQTQYKGKLGYVFVHFHEAFVRDVFSFVHLPVRVRRLCHDLKGAARPDSLAKIAPPGILDPLELAIRGRIRSAKYEIHRWFSGPVPQSKVVFYYGSLQALRSGAVQCMLPPRLETERETPSRKERPPRRSLP
jgi:hypothetical protein